jgi:hypothetical protein
VAAVLAPARRALVVSGPDAAPSRPDGPAAAAPMHRNGDNAAMASVAWLALLGLALLGCSAATCRWSRIEVAHKEERARIENVSRGLLQTTGTGRLEPVVTPGVVREFWIESRSGEWYRVTPEQFHSAAVGAPIEICRQ